MNIYDGIQGTRIYCGNDSVITFGTISYELQE